MAEPPSIDGALEEWGGRLSPVDDRVSMGTLSTDSLLYVAVAIQNEDLIRSVVQNGLIVWVDPEGGQGRTYGIQYPLGLRSQGPGQEAPDVQGSGAPGGTRGLDQLDLSELDIIRNDTVRQRIPAHFSSGLRAETTIDPGSFIYEVAIPTGLDAGTAGQQHGLLTTLTLPVNVGLQTPESGDEPNLGDDQGIPSVTGGGGGGRAPGGRRPGGRAPGTRGRTGQQGQQSPPPDPAQQIPTLDAWAKVLPADE